MLNIAEQDYNTYSQIAINCPAFAGSSVNEDFVNVISAKLEKMKSMNDPVNLSSKLHSVNDLIGDLYSKHCFQYKGTLYALKNELDEAINLVFSLATSIEGTTEEERTHRYYLFNNLAKSPATSLEVLSGMIDLLDPINNKHKVAILSEIAFHKRSSPDVLLKVLEEAKEIKTGKDFETKALRNFAYQIIVESLAMNPKKTPEITEAWNRITKKGTNRLFKMEINQIDPQTHTILTQQLGKLIIQLHVKDLPKPLKF
jgi:hypothetical protein